MHDGTYRRSVQGEYGALADNVSISTKTSPMKGLSDEFLAKMRNMLQKNPAPEKLRKYKQEYHNDLPMINTKLPKKSL